MNLADKVLLLDLLGKASSEMMQLGQTLYIGQKFVVCAELGQHIAKLRTEIEIGNQHASSDVWRIFAPTCDWDDAGGSPEIADAICKLLESKDL